MRMVCTMRFKRNGKVIAFHMVDLENGRNSIESYSAIKERLCGVLKKYYENLTISIDGSIRYTDDSCLASEEASLADLKASLMNSMQWKRDCKIFENNLGQFMDKGSQPFTSLAVMEDDYFDYLGPQFQHVFRKFKLSGAGKPAEIVLGYNVLTGRYTMYLNNTWTFEGDLRTVTSRASKELIELADFKRSSGDYRDLAETIFKNLETITQEIEEHTGMGANPINYTSVKKEECVADEIIGYTYRFDVPNGLKNKYVGPDCYIGIQSTNLTDDHYQMMIIDPTGVQRELGNFHELHIKLKAWLGKPNVMIKAETKKNTAENVKKASSVKGLFDAFRRK